MDPFSHPKSPEGTVTSSTTTTTNTGVNALRTRPVRTPDSAKQRRGRSKTCTGTTTLNGSLIKASWPSPSHSNNTMVTSSSGKNPVGFSHFSSVPNLNFGGRMPTPSSSANSTYIFGSSTSVFTSSSSQQLTHRDTDSEEAMDIDGQEDMDTQVGQVVTVTSTVDAPIVSSNATVIEPGKEIPSESDSSSESGGIISAPASSSVSTASLPPTSRKTDKEETNTATKPTTIPSNTSEVSKGKGSAGKKKAIYIVMHVGKVCIGDLQAKAQAPIKIYAEKVFMELELAEGQKSMSCRIPLKDFSQLLVCFESPNPVLAFTFTQSGAKAFLDKNKDKGEFIDHNSEDCKRRRLVLHMNCNTVPHDVKADLLELFQKRMANTITWKEMSSTDMKAELEPGHPVVEPVSETSNESTLQAEKSSSIASPTVSPAVGTKEGRKILTPKKSSSARRKLYERAPSSPSKSNPSTNDTVENVLDNSPHAETVAETSESGSQVQTRSRRRKAEALTSVTSPFPAEASLSSSPSQVHSSPVRLRDAAMLGLRDSPTRLRDSPTRLRDSPTRLRDSPTRLRDSSARLRDSPARRDTPFPSSLSDVKRDIFSRLTTSGDVRDIFPSANQEDFSVTPPTRDVKVFSNTASGHDDEDRDATSNASFNGYRDTSEPKDVTPPFERESKVRDVFHHHDHMESHINLLGKHSEKQRYTLEQHQKLLSLERAERTRNLEKIQDLRLTLVERDHLMSQHRDEIALLNREIENLSVTVTQLQHELEQERESSSRIRKLQTDLAQARRALDEERVLRSMREQQLQEKERMLAELQRGFKEGTEARRDLESELRNVRSTCLQHMDELENQRLFRQTQDREIQGREDRLSATERRYQMEHMTRIRIEEDLTQLRIDRDELRCSKEFLQAERTREREQINEERTVINEERRSYEERIRENEATITQLREQLNTVTQGEEQLREQENTIAQNERRLRELQAAVGSRQTMLDECRRIEPRDWLIRREEVTITEVTLGTGAWGSVKVGKFRGTKVAVKQIHELILSPHNRRLFEREMSIASRCRHPCLLQFIGATNDDGIPVFLTEILDADLRAVLTHRALHQEERVAIALDCARALNYLHLNKPFPIIHRDISSSNVLLWKRDSCWRAKLSDYGAANFMRQYMTVNPGAGIYAAPEASTSQQSPKVDVYSFGLLLCEMCIRELPVPQQTLEQVNLITSGVSRELVMRCTQADPEARPSMGEIITLLEQLEENLRDRGLVQINGRSATI